MKTFCLVFSLFVSAFASVAFAATSVVEGTIAKFVPAKTEIYVKSSADGKKHEYYFNKETLVTDASGQPSSFDQLEVGQAVRVTAEKKGKRLDPQKVEILK